MALDDNRDTFINSRVTNDYESIILILIKGGEQVADSLPLVIRNRGS